MHSHLELLRQAVAFFNEVQVQELLCHQAHTDMSGWYVNTCNQLPFLSASVCCVSTAAAT